MNLIDLIKRRDRPLEKSLVKVEGVIEPCNADFDGAVGLKDHPEAEFLFQIVGDGGAVVLGISEHLDLRGPLFAYARGNGLEIGPGLQPQIRPAPGVDIRYLEQSPIEEWQQLYN